MTTLSLQLSSDCNDAIGLRQTISGGSAANTW